MHITIVWPKGRLKKLALKYQISIKPVAYFVFQIVMNILFGLKFASAYLYIASIRHYLLFMFVLPEDSTK